MDFTASVTDIDAVTKKLSISVPAEAFKKRFDAALVNLSNKVRIKGFREGKAPRHLVESLHGDRVRSEVSGEIIQDSIKDAAKKHNLSIVGSPSVTLSSAELGKPFEFTADFAIYPQPEIVGYEGLEISVPKQEVSDKDVAEAIEALRKTRATVAPLAGRTKIAVGDVANGMFVVTEEGGVASKPEPYSFSLGEGNLPPELETAIAGMEIGEKRTATVAAKDEKAKAVTYEVELKTLSERILPELDDAFAKLVEPGVATVAELKAKVRERLEEQKKQQHEADVHSAIIDQLLLKNEFQVPQQLVDDEIRSILVNRGFINPQKMDPSQLPMDIFRKELGDAAARRVRAAIIVDRVGEKQGIKLEQADIEATINRIAKEQGMPVAEVQRILLGSDRSMGFMVETIRNKSLNFMKSKAKISFTAEKAEKKA